MQNYVRVFNSIMTAIQRDDAEAVHLLQQRPSKTNLNSVVRLYDYC